MSKRASIVFVVSVADYRLRHGLPVEVFGRGDSAYCVGGGVAGEEGCVVYDDGVGQLEIRRILLRLYVGDAAYRAHVGDEDRLDAPLPQPR